MDDAILLVDDERNLRVTLAQGHRLIRRTAEAAGVGHDRYEVQIVEAMNIQAAIEDTVTSFDAVFVGAARRSPLAERLFGSVPRMLAERMDGTLVIARSAMAKA